MVRSDKASLSRRIAVRRPRCHRQTALHYSARYSAARSAHSQSTPAARRPGSVSASIKAGAFNPGGGRILLCAYQTSFLKHVPPAASQRRSRRLNLIQLVPKSSCVHSVVRCAGQSSKRVQSQGRITASCLISIGQRGPCPPREELGSGVTNDPWRLVYDIEARRLFVENSLDKSNFNRRLHGPGSWARSAAAACMVIPGHVPQHARGN